MGPATRNALSDITERPILRGAIPADRIRQDSLIGHPKLVQLPFGSGTHIGTLASFQSEASIMGAGGRSPPMFYVEGSNC